MIYILGSPSQRYKKGDTWFCNFSDMVRDYILMICNYQFYDETIKWLHQSNHVGDDSHYLTSGW